MQQGAVGADLSPGKFDCSILPELLKFCFPFRMLYACCYTRYNIIGVRNHVIFSVSGCGLLPGPTAEQERAVGADPGPGKFDSR